MVIDVTMRGARPLRRLKRPPVFAPHVGCPQKAQKAPGPARRGRARPAWPSWATTAWPSCACLPRSGGALGWQPRGSSCAWSYRWPCRHRPGAMADDGVSLPHGNLPPDVLSEEGSGSDVCSPCPALGTKCACKNRCYEKVSLQAVRDSREQLLILSRKDRARLKLILAAASGPVCDRDGNVKPRYRHRTFQGVHVCKPFWEYAHAVGPAGVGMAKKCLQMGADRPPARLPRLPAEKTKFNDADTWFLDLYQSLGEPLAEVYPSFLDAEGCVPIDDADHLLWSLRIAINNGQYARKRYLSCTSFEDLFLMYEAMVPVGSRCPSRYCTAFGRSGGGSSCPFAMLSPGKGARSARRLIRIGAWPQ